MNDNFEVKYEDSDILVVYKPAGLATQSGKVGDVDLESLLKKYRKSKGEVAEIFTVHRLDKPVSGLLVFAKTKQAAANLSKQLEKGSLNKRYTVAVMGDVEPCGEISGFIKKEGNIALFSSEKKDLYYKKSMLKYKRMGYLDEGKKVSKLTVELETGRFHQIRVSFAGMGHPVLGDMKYGTTESNNLSKEMGIRNVCLCADYISFIHPRTGKCIELTI